MPLKLAAKVLSDEIAKKTEELEKKRQSAVICLYSSIENSHLVDDLEQKIEEKKNRGILKNKLDLILHTNGGSPDIAFSIGRKLQHSADNVCIMIPRKVQGHY